MKEEINLLPPVIQDARMGKLYDARVASVYVAFVVAILLVGIGYAGSWGVLKLTLVEITRSLSSGVAADSDKETRALNARIQFIHERLSGNPAFMPDVADALAVVPSDITITSIEIDHEDQTVYISGRATTRSAIVLFEERLQELSWVESVNAPLQNFASGPNVSFEFTITRSI